MDCSAPKRCSRRISVIPSFSNRWHEATLADWVESRSVTANAYRRRNVDDLARYTADGTPVVVRMEDKTTGFSHFVVVDGVTTKNGIEVVAVRDPNGAQYFSPRATFKQYFTGEVVVPRNP